MDIRDYEERLGRGRVARLPFRQLHLLGALLCEPVTLYGHYAFLVDYTYAVSAAKACGTTEYVRFGGESAASGRTPWIGLHRDGWTAIGLQPQRWIGDLGISPRTMFGIAHAHWNPWCHSWEIFRAKSLGAKINSSSWLTSHPTQPCSLAFGLIGMPPSKC
jgi:hypothetical protein